MDTYAVARASQYLDGYSVGIEARGNGKIAVAMTVDGTGVMEKIGVREVDVYKRQVVTVETIASSDWSYLQATFDNRITITTCLANQPSKRVCVQAVEVK